MCGGPWFRADAELMCPSSFGTGLRGGPMRRRGFVIGLGCAAAAWPFAARAQQQAKIYRIGILETVPAERNAANLEGLRKGLRELGYVEGRNLRIEYRSADGRAE